jgi:sugar lactone lactonase YvrE
MIWQVRKGLVLWRVLYVCTLALFLIPGVAVSEETYKFERMWPTLQQPWYLFMPQDVAMDEAGNIYIADTSNHRVQKYTSDGLFITGWGHRGNDDGEFDYPYSVATDPNGSVYVADNDNHRIQKFTSEGQFLTKWGSYGSGDGDLNSPSAIEIDRVGNVYVAESGNHRIQKFTSEGQFLTKWGSYGSGAGQFNYPAGIAVNGAGDIYVTDRDNHRVQKFTPDGEFVVQWGSWGSADGDFKFPSGIEIDNDGNVYVAQQGDCRIQKFDPSGEFIAKWGKVGNGDGDLGGPMGIEIDKAGNVFVAEDGNDRIQKLTPDGQFLVKWGGSGNNEGFFDWPMGITTDMNGNIFVADTKNNRVQKFTADGRFITQWGSPGSGDGEFKFPEGMTIDNQGNVYVADENDRIQKFTSDGQFITQWGSSGTGEGEFSLPWGMASDQDGNIYVVDFGNERVQKFTSDGHFIMKWGSHGGGDGEFYFPIGIAIGKQGEVYVADQMNDRIQKFAANGVFITKWGIEGTGDGEFSGPSGITIDGEGYVFVADRLNFRIQKFTPDGQFVTKWGSAGSSPGQMNWVDALAASPNGKIYVADSKNHRVQVFKQMTLSSNHKAIVVAGGGAYPGNDLWDATQMSANFAYRTLTYQGFTKENIHYLSSANIDLDDNGALDDVAGNATNENLENAVLSWASGADDVILYLVDHGGEGSFRMSGTETLSATDLSSWLDALQNSITGKVVVIYDACESGSFVSPLKAPPGKQRIVISSTSPDEKAYFLTQGSVSFSNYFWTHIFNGVNIKDAFNLAQEAITYTVPYQHPLLDANGNGIANEEEDDALVQNAYIGNGTMIYGSAPVIAEISSPQTITDTSSALLYATGVTDADGIARVWAVIRPPDYRQGSAANPVQDLPSIDLLPMEDDRYEVTYNVFTTPGTYQVAIYARDRIGNTSIPKVTQVSVINPLRRKAIIVAAGSQSDALWPAIEKNAGLAYGALKFQGYVDEDIYFMSPVTFSSGVDVAPTVNNLNNAITIWAATNTQDFVLYLIGNGGNGTFQISPTETLSVSDLEQWLDILQEIIPGKVVVIYDGPRSGSFLPLLTPPSGKQRILVSSTGSDQPAYFLSQGDLSFSKFFWSRVSNGMNVRDAYLHGKRALSFLGSNQEPFLDDNGNGIGNEKADGQVALSYTIGFGITLGADDPLIGSVSPPQTLTGQASTIVWAKDVTSTGNIVRVWAVITPPAASQTPGFPVTYLPTFDLVYDAGMNRYEGTYFQFNTQGQYTVAIYATDVEGNISLPSTTTVTQTGTLDPYEDDNIPGRASVVVLNDTLSQGHTFHAAGDLDWVKFYALSGEAYEVKTENLGARCDTVLTLYDSDGATVIRTVDDSTAGEGELLTWQCGEDDVYYIMVTQYEPSVYGEETGYDLRVYVPAAPPLVAFIKGTVTDAYSGDPMGGVKIKTDAKISALSLTDGNYLMIHPAGNFILTAEASGYGNFMDTLIITEAETINKNIAMDLIVLKGDVNHDGQVDLTDAILVLRAISRLDISGETIILGADVNEDGNIGMAEVVYVLQKAAGLR